jgi:hypothetical protein
MKALTLTQPWATLVVTGRKKIETRGWRTGFRGRVAIHAAKGMPGWAKEAAREFGLDPDALPRGAVIGKAYIGEMARTEDAREVLLEAGLAAELSMGDYDDGRWAWELHNATAFAQPIPAAGALGLWDWTPPGDDE